MDLPSSDENFGNGMVTLDLDVSFNFHFLEKMCAINIIPKNSIISLKFLKTDHKSSI